MILKKMKKRLKFPIVLFPVSAGREDKIRFLTRLHGLILSKSEKKTGEIKVWFPSHELNRLYREIVWILGNPPQGRVGR